MVIPSATFKRQNIPSVLNGDKLQYIDRYKYLGMFINVRYDNLDIVKN